MAGTRIKCPSCGALNVPGGGACSKCGGPIFAGSGAVKVPPAPGAGSKRGISYQLLCVAAVFAVLGGLMSLSNATVGVGLVALSCSLGVFARIAQATRHHDELIERIDAPRSESQRNTSSGA